MIDPKILDKIGKYAKSKGFDYHHSTQYGWAIFVGEDDRNISVDYNDVEWHDRCAIHFICGEYANEAEAKSIYKYFPEAMKILEMLENAPKERRA